MSSVCKLSENRRGSVGFFTVSQSLNCNIQQLVRKSYESLSFHLQSVLIVSRFLLALQAESLYFRVLQEISFEKNETLAEASNIFSACPLA